MTARLLLLLTLVAFDAFAQAPDPLVEIRRCGPPPRDAQGRILRSHAVLKAFQALHPCPANGSRDVNARCPGWQMNHVLPLAKGGCDAVWNLDWMPVQIKTCAAWYCRDRFEMKVYGEPPEIVVPR